MPSIPGLGAFPPHETHDFRKLCLPGETVCYDDAGPFTPEGVKPFEGDVMTRDKPVRPCWEFRCVELQETGTYPQWETVCLRHF